MDPEILQDCEVKTYKKGDVIIRQKDQVDGMYVIKRGKAQVEMDGAPVAVLRKSDFFGEMGLLLHEPRNATVTVITDELVTHFLSRQKFEEIRKNVQEEVIAKLLERTIENCKREHSAE